MADIQRDNVVEEMLRVDSERLPDSVAGATAGATKTTTATANTAAHGNGGKNGTGVEADEEMAERFKREFLENNLGHGHHHGGAGASGAGRVPAKTALAGGKGKDEGRPSGPRMGGSRSMRAAAHKNRVAK